ncbi:MAG: efflux RND transporter periplasmic adaptor subunit, partial [Planctomycetota bacterium]
RAGGRVLSVRTVLANRNTLGAFERTLTGEVTARRTSNLGFQRGGELSAIYVDEGAAVAAGDRLAVLDTRSLEARRAELEARLRQGEARLAELRAGARPEVRQRARLAVDGLTHELQLAELLTDRQTRLLARQATSRHSVDEASLRRDALRSRLESARQSSLELEAGAREEVVAAQEAEVAAVEAAIRSLNVQLTQSVLSAPFAGTVSVRFADEGTVLAPGGPVVRLVESGALEVRVGVPVELAARVEDARVLSVITRGVRSSGRLVTVLPELDRATRTLTAIVAIDPEDAGHPVTGELASVRVPAGASAEPEPVGGSPTLDLPLSALTQGARGLFAVYAVEPTGGLAGRVVRHEVEVLGTRDGRARVRGSLTEGAHVIADGLHRVTPGQSVRIESIAIRVGEEE